MDTVSGFIKKKIRLNSRGFTLIEMVVVIAVISILAMIAVPRVTRVFSSQRQNFAIFTGMIASTFDDAFLKNREDILAVYLNAPDPEDPMGQKEIFNRRNGIAVINSINGEFYDSKRKTLQFKQFSQNFIIEEVLTPTGETFTSGWIPITFYPQGYSNNYIIHVLVNGEQKWSIRIDKHLKEPKVMEGYASLEIE
ncbi:MAG: prepilin-type N-terminal cleavage/methylation domain-containing protein [Spirochaetes bacterium]|nr:prepilin-type N-terminal cleavage/methylation domain-containing protein [Spirochaetota bacterium]